MTEAETSHSRASTELKASKNALTFMSGIGPTDIDRCLFADFLVTVSDSGRELGEFCVDIKKTTYNNEPCYLVHANSYGAIDGIPCGTSVTAYVSGRLETIEQNQHEYVKLQEQVTLDKKTHIKRQNDHLVVNRIITEKEEVRRQAFSFSLHSLEGFVSEASNLLILRILAQQKKIPDNMTFLSFDADTSIAVSTYMSFTSYIQRELGTKQQTVGNEVVEVTGIERTISVPDDGTATWHCYFLSDGHLASRLQLGSPVTMNLLQLPRLRAEDERDQKPLFEKKPLIWEEDMELYSKFLDRKEELKADHSSYIRHHPELKALLADFLQFLLLRKPPDVFTFAHEFFAAFSARYPLCSTMKGSQASTRGEVLRNQNVLTKKF